jgi:hypothetical protein
MLLAALVALPALAADGKGKKKAAEKEVDEEEEMAAPAEQIDEDAFREDEPDEDAPARPKEDEKGDESEEPDEGTLDLDDEDEGEAIKFEAEDEQQALQPRQKGEDTAKLYRDQEKRVANMTPDEELLAWESYVQRYPKSLFRERIDNRMEELSALLFSERVAGSDKGARATDGAKRELDFATPVKLMPVDTRTHAAVGVQYGFPGYFGGNIDLEYAFLRQASAHVRFFRDFAGGAFMVGPKYAVLKSARTGTMVTGALDVKFNGSPFFTSIRPTLAAGQRFRLLRGLDLQLQVAADFELRDDSDTRWFGGFSAELQPTEIVWIYAETSLDVKYLDRDPDSFRFFVSTFGLKFRVFKGTDDNGKLRTLVGLAADAPYSKAYWGFYQGSFILFANTYL